MTLTSSENVTPRGYPFEKEDNNRDKRNGCGVLERTGARLQETEGTCRNIIEEAKQTKQMKNARWTWISLENRILLESGKIVPSSPEVRISHTQGTSRSAFLA